jgi:hypothetical protein
MKNAAGSAGGLALHGRIIPDRGQREQEIHCDAWPPMASLDLRVSAALR